ncbi:hypothetical protein FOA52_014076 [Chlamydomonas sp. UWO 241]|nr:hypothetical protein FOA52_014076 [Chlamydomonas sp. UWO 241]
MHAVAGGGAPGEEEEEVIYISDSSSPSSSPRPGSFSGRGRPGGRRTAGAPGQASPCIVDLRSPHRSAEPPHPDASQQSPPRKRGGRELRALFKGGRGAELGSDRDDQGGATADDRSPLWVLGSMLVGDEAQLFRGMRELYLEYLSSVGCADTLWSARVSSPAAARHPFTLGNDISAKPCGNGRSYLAKADELWDGVPAVKHRFHETCNACEADNEYQIVASAFPPGRYGNLTSFVNDRPLPPSGGDAGASAGGSGPVATGLGPGPGHAPCRKLSRANATIVNVRALAVPMGVKREDRQDHGVGGSGRASDHGLAVAVCSPCHSQLGGRSSVKRDNPQDRSMGGSGRMGDCGGMGGGGGGGGGARAGEVDTEQEWAEAAGAANVEATLLGEAPTKQAS